MHVVYYRLKQVTDQPDDLIVSIHPCLNCDGYELDFSSWSADKAMVHFQHCTAHIIFAKCQNIEEVGAYYSSVLNLVKSF